MTSSLILPDPFLARPGGLGGVLGKPGPASADMVGEVFIGVAAWSWFGGWDRLGGIARVAPPSGDQIFPAPLLLLENQHRFGRSGRDLTHEALRGFPG